MSPRGFAGRSAEVDLEHGCQHAGGDEADAAERGADQDLQAHGAAFHAIEQLDHIGNLLRRIGRFFGRRSVIRALEDVAIILVPMLGVLLLVIRLPD